MEVAALQQSLSKIVVIIWQRSAVGTALQNPAENKRFCKLGSKIELLSNSCGPSKTALSITISPDSSAVCLVSPRLASTAFLIVVQHLELQRVPWLIANHVFLPETCIFPSPLANHKPRGPCISHTFERLEDLAIA